MTTKTLPDDDCTAIEIIRFALNGTFRKGEEQYERVYLTQMDIRFPWSGGGSCELGSQILEETDLFLFSQLIIHYFICSTSWIRFIYADTHTLLQKVQQGFIQRTEERANGWFWRSDPWSYGDSNQIWRVSIASCHRCELLLIFSAVLLFLIIFAVIHTYINVFKMNLDGGISPRLINKND